MTLQSLAKRFAGTVLLFSTIVGVGTSLVLLVSSSLGYLSYSDRPGPGWWGRVHFPSWVEFSNYIGFAPWFAYFCLFAGVGLFGLSLVLGISSAPRWLNRVLGGAISAAAAGLAVAGAGWYIALAQIGPGAAMLLGLLYGIFVFPHFIQPRAQPLTAWIRVGAISAAASVFLWWLAMPFFPKEVTPEISYDLVRITDGDKPVLIGSNLSSSISKDIDALGLHGVVHGGVGSFSGPSQASPRIEIQMIALEPIKKETYLEIPESGHVVYVLKNGAWTAHSLIREKDARKIIIAAGTDQHYDGGRIRVGKGSTFHTFTWYPVILRDR